MKKKFALKFEDTQNTENHKLSLQMHSSSELVHIVEDMHVLLLDVADDRWNTLEQRSSRCLQRSSSKGRSFGFASSLVLSQIGQGGELAAWQTYMRKGCKATIG